MKSLKVFILFVLYCGALWAGFIGIKHLESFSADLWFDFITKRTVAKKVHLPTETAILGVYKPELPYSFGPAKDFEEKLGTEFTLISFYQAWGDQNENRFNHKIMNRISDNGKVPVITWEPWVNGFTSESLRPMPEREWKCLSRIASGKYDSYIREWARSAVKWQKPFFLRFAHETTNDQYPWGPKNGNTAEDFKDAWWHVKSIFDSLGATNVIWVWSPYKPEEVPDYYPGEESVDWIAMDIFNYGELLQGPTKQRWMSFDALASPLYRKLRPLQKPLMIAEVGCGRIGGSRSVWYREMLNQIRNKFTSVKAIVLFENPNDRTSEKWNIDWSISNDKEVIEEIKPIISSDAFSFIESYGSRLSGNSNPKKE